MLSNSSYNKLCHRKKLGGPKVQGMLDISKCLLNIGYIKPMKHSTRSLSLYSIFLMAIVNSVCFLKIHSGKKSSKVYLECLPYFQHRRQQRNMR